MNSHGKAHRERDVGTVQAGRYHVRGIGRGAARLERDLGAVVVKQFVVLAALAVGLSACHGPTSAGAATGSRTSGASDLTNWQPEPYVATNPLPVGYEGLDVDLLRDFYLVNNKIQLKKEASESMKGYIERVSSPAALSPLAYGESYAIPVEMELFYARDRQGYVLRSDMFCNGNADDPLIARCFLTTTDHDLHEPSMGGRGPANRARAERTSFSVAILSEHLQGEPFSVIEDELRTWDLEIPVEAPDDRTIDSADIGTLLIGSFTSALGFQVEREHVYPSLGWELLTRDLDQLDPDVPIIIRTIAAPFSPTGLVVYIRSTGEVLTEFQID